MSPAAELVSALRSNSDAVLPHFSAPAAELERSYSPAAGKWTARQVLLHIVDVEVMLLSRLQYAVAEPGFHVPLWDENRAMTALCPPTRSLATARALFLGARGRIIELVESLDDDALARAIVHPERGEITARELAAKVVAHSAHHLAQVEAARAGRTWHPNQA
jgi:uncharacterized damage-inducible protein DinB